MLIDRLRRRNNLSMGLSMRKRKTWRIFLSNSRNNRKVTSLSYKRKTSTRQPISLILNCSSNNRNTSGKWRKSRISNYKQFKKTTTYKTLKYKCHFKEKAARIWQKEFDKKKSKTKTWSIKSSKSIQDKSNKLKKCTIKGWKRTFNIMINF